MTGGQRLAEYGNQYHRDFTRSITEPSSEKHEEKISNNDFLHCFHSGEIFQIFKVDFGRIR